MNTGLTGTGALRTPMSGAIPLLNPPSRPRSSTVLRRLEDRGFHPHPPPTAAARGRGHSTRSIRQVDPSAQRHHGPPRPGLAATAGQGEPNLVGATPRPRSASARPACLLPVQSVRAADPRRDSHSAPIAAKDRIRDPVLVARPAAAIYPSRHAARRLRLGRARLRKTALPRPSFPPFPRFDHRLGRSGKGSTPAAPPLHRLEPVGHHQPPEAAPAHSTSRPKDARAPTPAWAVPHRTCVTPAVFAQYGHDMIQRHRLDRPVDPVPPAASSPRPPPLPIIRNTPPRAAHSQVQTWALPISTIGPP